MEKHTLWKKWIAIALHQVGCLIAVLTVFSAEYYLKATGVRTSVWVLVLAAVGLVVAFVMMGYLAGATSSSAAIDHIGGDVLIVVYALALFLVLDKIIPIHLDTFSFSDKLVAIGVIAYLFDVAFLVCYLSIVRRIKSHTLWSGSLIGRLWNFVSKGLFRKNMVVRALRGLVAWAIAILGAVIFFTYKEWWGLLIILLSAVIELFFSLRKAQEQKEIREDILEITNGNLEASLNPERYHGEEKITAEAVNHIRDGLGAAVDREIKNERMKAELITNVSHDLKTPLTSIINYVGILKKEVKDEGPAKDHLEILEEKSLRMKSLVEDLVDVSRITSGNMKYEITKLDFVELIYEAGGELEDRFADRDLKVVSGLSRLPLYIEADGRQLFRAIENLYTNAAKYAREGSVVNVSLSRKDDSAIFTIKNAMQDSIKLDGDAAEDLTERFVRGDKARTTEGSGLGLSIAKNMIEQMGGNFAVYVEEDVFIAYIAFKIV